MALTKEDRAKFEKYHAEWLAEVDPDGTQGVAWPRDYELRLENPWTVTIDGVSIDFYNVGEDSWWAVGVSGDVRFGPTFEGCVDEAWDPTTDAEREADKIAEKVRSDWWDLRVLLGEWDESYAAAGSVVPSVYRRDPTSHAYAGAELIEIADRMAKGEMN